MKLSDYSEGRDNNFNLIRILAAYAVFITHSYALSVGSGSAEPAIKNIDLSLGMVAVDIFFITSGFLVTASLLNRDSIIDFIWARVLRIYPALIVMLFLTTFGLGVFFTTLPWSSYISDSQVYKYLLKCSSLIGGVSFNLPGVFEPNPYKNAVNGSLWSMPWEVRMYAFLALFGLVIGVLCKDRIKKLKILKIIIIFSVIMAAIFLSYYHFIASGKSCYLKLYVLFFSGALYYILKNKIELSRKIFISIIFIFVISTINKHTFYFLYILTLPYILFYIAYIPSGFIRKYNKLDDYSYGVYIYAFPIQQSFAALIPGISVLQLIIFSTISTFIMAYLSWHIIEKHALRLKKDYSDNTKKLFVYFLKKTTHQLSRQTQSWRV